MTLVARLLRYLFGPSKAPLLEDLHVRLLNDWISTLDDSFIHPICTWKLTEGHPWAGVYEGRHFYDYYWPAISTTYPGWQEVIQEVIGTSIGGIVVGHYLFQSTTNGPWYTAPFTHFYHIANHQAVTVRFFMGEISPASSLSGQVINWSALPVFYSLN
ncbi:nuclear transport factor 2 family protein [Spirosoma soli]|uniref:Nuclear transport factor 2 family protein n=1 Tax=Spirosoma soli TaxID=1770529 RepID=A0ABW5M4Q2_9BACT